MASHASRLQVQRDQPFAAEAAMHMVYVARAYPDFKNELEAAITEGSADAAGKAMLLNIQFLCEFAIQWSIQLIPVSMIELTMRSDM